MHWFIIFKQQQDADKVWVIALIQWQKAEAIVKFVIFAAMVHRSDPASGLAI